MKCENGKAIFKGVAVGRIVFCEPKERMVKRKRVQDTEHEIIPLPAGKETGTAGAGRNLSQIIENDRGSTGRDF